MWNRLQNKRHKSDEQFLSFTELFMLVQLSNVRKHATAAKTCTPAWDLFMATLFKGRLSSETVSELTLEGPFIQLTTLLNK